MDKTDFWDKVSDKMKERQRLNELKAPEGPEVSAQPDIKNKNEESSRLMSEELKKSEKIFDTSLMVEMDKRLSLLTSAYKKILFEYRETQEKLIRTAVLWKISTIWLVILMLGISGVIGYYFYATKIALLDNKKALSEIQKNRDLLNKRVFLVSDRLQEAQIDLMKTKDDFNIIVNDLQDKLNEKELYIKDLESVIQREGKIKRILSNLEKIKENGKIENNEQSE